MIDSHCHLEYMKTEEIIKEAKDTMTALVSSVADIKDAQKMLDTHKKHPKFVFACLGFHPEVMKNYKEEDLEEYLNFIGKNKDQIAAIGEVGLDYNWITEKEGQEKSKKVFQKFIDISKELDKPLVIHSRNGRDNSVNGIGDAINMLIENNCKKVMMHCFSGSETQLKLCLEQGWMISFATLVVKSFKHQRLAKLTPIEQMLLETDAPWLDPDSNELVNRPWKIERSAEVIAGIKNLTKEEILARTEENAKRFFGID